MRRISSAALLFSASLFAQTWSGILDPTRAIDWTAVGIPGGIPARTTICATVTASSGDRTSAIQTALNACPANQAVLLGPGTFRIDTYLSIPSNVTLRGSGADKTILDLRGTTNSVAIVMGTGDPVNPVAWNTPITSGSTQGSQSMVVSDVTNFSSQFTGPQSLYVQITELNDPAYVSNVGSGGTITWNDGWYSGTRSKGQIVEVDSVSGTTITFHPPLYSNYTHTPAALPFLPSVKFAGLENLQFYANNTGYGYHVTLSRCMYCWVKGVQGNYIDGNGDHIDIAFGFRDEIRDSYFSGAYRHTSGSTENEIKLSFKTSGCLIENNIFERLQTSVNLARGSAGNVVAYNYMTGGFDEQSASLGSMGAIYFHEAHPHYNLLEGNVLPTIYPDSVWGTSSHNTMYRNWAKGTAKTCIPLTGRGTVNCTGANGVWQTIGTRAMQNDGLSTSNNYLANVVGSAEQSALPVAKVASIQWPSARGWDTVTYGWSWGYTSLGDGGGNSLDSTTSYTTAFLHGNYNNIDSSLVWANGTTHTLPASLFRSSKPAWFGSNTWPAIGPDVTGGGPGNYTSAIPAQTCYAAMGGTEGGAGGPYVFNADNCYSSGPGGNGAPPTAVKLTLR